MDQLLQVITILVLCDVVPALMVYMMFPRLSGVAPACENYRGAKVVNGLGIAWFIWLALLWCSSVVFNAAGWGVPGWLSLMLVAFPLVAGSCIFGMFDDWMDDGSAKGFKGHLRELSHGKMTTGMLKMVGIGLLSLFTAIYILEPGEQLPVLRVILSFLTMSLCANLLNLLDLRPLRATKVYVVLALLGVIAIFACGKAGAGFLPVVCVLLACAGPVIATFRFDNLEIAMLGDSGANAMGSFVGFLFAVSLPTWLLGVVAVLLLILNLSSEKVSFSRVIAQTPALRKIDMLFRPKSFIRTGRGGGGRGNRRG